MIHRWLRRSVLLLVLLSVILPSGSIYGVNVKIGLSIPIIVLLIVDILSVRIVPRFIVILGCLIAVFVFFSISVAYNNSVPIDSVISETKAFLSVFAIVIPATFIIIRRYISAEEFLSFVFKISVIHCWIKILVEAMLVFGLMSESTLRYGIPAVFGADILLLDYGTFFRINMAGDFVLPIALFSAYVFPAIVRQETYRKISIATIIFGIFLTYSRYLWIYGVIAAVFGYIVARSGNLSNQRIGTIGARTAKVVIVCGFGLVFLLLSGWSGNIIDRFVGVNAISSDSQRMGMFLPLLHGVLENPFLGMGMGGYVNEIIRVERLPWNYELQWLAFAMQFGLLGFVILLAIAIAPLILFVRMTETGLTYAIMYLLWIGVGIFNCFLLTSAAGVVFAGFIAFGINLRQFNRYLKGQRINVEGVDAWVTRGIVAK